MIFSVALIFVYFFELTRAQLGCGQIPTYQFPSPPILTQPCVYPTTPSPQPAILNCKGCPDYWNLPPLLPVPRVFPDIASEETLGRPNEQSLFKDTKITRHDPSNENSTKIELLDNPERDYNTSFFVSPIVPETASYKHPHYLYNYAPISYGYGCQPQTLPPLIFTTPPPLVIPTLPPLNNCCGRCQCGYYPKMRASRVFRREQIASRCTNKNLQSIMEENRDMEIKEAKIRIQRQAELKLRDGYYHVFCSAQNLEYVTRTESYCTFEMSDGICYAFRTQAFV